MARCAIFTNLTPTVYLGLAQQEEHMQVPNGTGPDVWGVNVPCPHITPVANCSMETSSHLVKGLFR